MLGVVLTLVSLATLLAISRWLGAAADPSTSSALPSSPFPCPSVLPRSLNLPNLIYACSIGDHAAPRAPFQILIALTAAPRFILLALQWIAHRYPPRGRSTSSLPRPSDSSSSVAGVTGLGSDTSGVRARKRDAIDVDTPAALDAEDGHGHAVDVQGPPSGWVDVEVMCGLGRTFCCGGWMYITSRDQHGESKAVAGIAQPAAVSLEHCSHQTSTTSS